VSVFAYRVIESGVTDRVQSARERCVRDSVRGAGDMFFRDCVLMSERGVLVTITECEGEVCVLRCTECEIVVCQ